jgi:hypothetical protein
MAAEAMLDCCMAADLIEGGPPVWCVGCGGEHNDGSMTPQGRQLPASFAYRLLF